jgi:hypothetical protein
MLKLGKDSVSTDLMIKGFQSKKVSTGRKKWLSDTQHIELHQNTTQRNNIGHIWLVSFMLSVVMVNVIMLSVIVSF